MTHDPDCIFCRIVAGRAPAYVVVEDDRSVAFLDRGQATEGHTLVVPRTHASDIWTVSQTDLIAVMLIAKHVAQRPRDARERCNVSRSYFRTLTRKDA